MKIYRRYPRKLKKSWKKRIMANIQEVSPGTKYKLTYGKRG